ncbi:hypothetical protein MNBD_GAMMA26-946 [hydrothermal vent metagenome]|uniref:Uncharacterized protein n=1 Tax=hydrothermal vent metagenome TaxID=652676 RepID=A0A3B1AWN3_9ZZZZ
MYFLQAKRHLDAGKYTIKMIQQTDRIEEYYGSEDIVIVIEGVRRVFLNLKQQAEHSKFDNGKHKDKK